MEALHHHLRSKLEKLYFRATSRYVVPGLLISAATIICSGFAMEWSQRPLVVCGAIWLLPWSLASVILGRFTLEAWRNALSDPHHARAARKRAMVISAAWLAVLLSEVAGLWVMAWAASTGWVVLLLLLAAINYLFYVLLKAPTRLGRALASRIEGFRRFLAATEQDGPGGRTPRESPCDLFERFLPYAIALNVEKGWGERFASALAHTAPRGARGYSPGWYSGPSWDPITLSNFATSLGNSFSSAVSLSTTAPGLKPRRR